MSESLFDEGYDYDGKRGEIYDYVEVEEHTEYGI